MYFVTCYVDVVVCICLQIRLIKRPPKCTVIFPVTYVALVQTLDKFKLRLVTSR